MDTSVIDSLPERSRIAISDNIRLRCGCKGRTRSAPSAGRIRILWCLRPIRRGVEVVTVTECLTCRAAWEWGEICAQEDKRLAKVQRMCRALRVAVPTRLPPPRSK